MHAFSCLQYIAMYSDIGQKSNTMIFSDRPADVNALLAQATAVVRSMAAPASGESNAAAASRSVSESSDSSDEYEEEAPEQPEHK